MRNRGRLYDPDPEGSGGGGDEKFTIKVNGVEKEFTKAEILERASKAEGADENFRKAAAKEKELAEKEKELGSARQFEADAQALKDNPNDEAAFRRMATRLGWSKEDIETAITSKRQAEIQAAMGSGTPDDNDEGSGSEGGALTSSKVEAMIQAALGKVLPAAISGTQIGVDQMDPRLRAALLNVVNQGIEANLKKGVDSDPLLGKIKKYGSDEQKSELAELVQQEAMRRAASGDDLTDLDKLAAAIQAVKQRVERLGVKPANEPRPTGLGSSSTSGMGVHLNEKPVERPKAGMGDPNYSSYINDLLRRGVASTPEG